jgi:hypothetical protein
MTTTNPIPKRPSNNITNQRRMENQENSIFIVSILITTKYSNI